MVPTEPELISLIGSTRVAVSLRRPRAAALDVLWGRRPRAPALRNGVVLGLCPSPLEVPVWKGSGWGREQVLSSRERRVQLWLQTLPPCLAPGRGHQGTCPQESVYCENKCGARMMRRLLSQHTLAECPKRTQPCTYCAKEFVFDTIQNHQYQCPRYPVPCPNQCGTPSIAREDVPTHLKESCSTAMLLCPFKEAGCKHRCPKLAMGRHLEESTKAHLGMVCALVSRQRQEILGRRRGGGGPRSNYESSSPPFYPHKYGYKLQVSAFLNGNGSGESSHLSVYIRVLPGEYDNLLEWPFSYRVTFSLLDQSDPSLSKPQHITETFHPDPNWKNFQKPGASRSSLDESTLGFGYPKFISHEDIKKRNYVRDNAIFIKASVEIPQKILA
nr:PREDICTED: TNF receptor-associated factor 4 [Opisthocomus hoazin]